MDIRKSLILIYDKNMLKFVDKTSKINKITKSMYNGCVDVYYYGGSTKYTTPTKNMIRLGNPTVIDLINNEVYLDGNPCRGLVEYLDFGPYVRLIYRDYNEVVLKKRIRLKRINNALRVNLYNYLNEIIHIIRPVSESDDMVAKSLEGGLELFNSLDRESFLYYFINDEISFVNRSRNLIYPFGANKSQRDATIKAINNRVSIIEGPPGTGKTQTILNIIANLVIADKSVAVVSSKNEALLNISEKLHKYNYDFILGELGSSSNKRRFFDLPQRKVSDILSSLTYDEGFSPTEAKEKIKRYQELENLDCRNAICINDERNLRIEYQSFMLGYSKDAVIPKSILNRFKDDYLYLVNIISNGLNKNRGRLYYIFKLKKYISKEAFKEIDGWIDTLTRMHYESRLDKLLSEIRANNKRLEDSKYNELRGEIDSIYNNLFKYNLRKKYERVGDISFGYTKEEGKVAFKRYYKEFVERFPVITSTTFSLQASKTDEFIFDYLIMDESSQADIASTLMAFAMARNVVIIGDSKQLDKIISSEQSEILDKIFSKYKLPAEFSYSANNALSMVKGRCKSKSFETLINEHFRCDPYIIGFCNKRFYNDELIIRTTHKDENKIRVIKTNAHQNRNNTNLRQAEEIVKAIKEIKEDDSIRKGNDKSYKERTIGVIAPFRNQVALLKEMIEPNYPDVQIGTIHKFQGRENDVILMSTVKNSIKDSDDFLEKRDLMNVAISRAKKSLYVFVSDELINQENTILNDFLRYEELINTSLEVVNGSIQSIFDMMYTDYQAAMSKSEQGEYEFKSELIFADTLKGKVLIGDLEHLKFLHNYPLFYLVNNSFYKNLTSDEIRFIRTCMSHIDFLIYNNASKKAVCAIEVDGSQHQSDLKQVHRDELKNSILEKLGLPLIRYKTVDSVTGSKIVEDIKKYI